MYMNLYDCINVNIKLIHSLRSTNIYFKIKTYKHNKNKRTQDSNTSKWCKTISVACRMGKAKVATQPEMSHSVGFLHNNVVIIMRVRVHVWD